MHSLFIESFQLHHLCQAVECAWKNRNLRTSCHSHMKPRDRPESQLGQNTVKKTKRKGCIHSPYLFNLYVESLSLNISATESKAHFTQSPTYKIKTNTTLKNSSIFYQTNIHWQCFAIFPLQHNLVNMQIYFYCLICIFFHLLHFPSQNMGFGFLFFNGSYCTRHAYSFAYLFVTILNNPLNTELTENVLDNQM